MTDRELLELAAKACGELTPHWYGNDAYFDGVLQRWNPLLDDGDALRLAAKLKIELEWRVTNAASEQLVEAYRLIGAFFFATEHEDDYRRAIVRVAAEVGKGME